jgi:hypothetical protein
MRQTRPLHDPLRMRDIHDYGPPRRPIVFFHHTGKPHIPDSRLLNIKLEVSGA